MNILIETLLVALSLSMDAFAVSVSSAACSKGLRTRHMIRAAFAFGLFQFIMPLVGWFLGSAFRGLIASFDHWIAFGLLAIVGGKMLVEVVSEWREQPDPNACPTEGEMAKRDLGSKRVTLALAVATSIDALAVGMGFSVIGREALMPSVIIGLVTFAVCLAGFFFGKRIGLLLGRWAQLAGGLVLIGIGARMLLSHLAAGI